MAHDPDQGRKRQGEEQSVGLEPGHEIGEMLNHEGKYTRIIGSGT